MESTKVDIVYYVVPTDFEMEFNLSGCCRMRLLTSLTHDRKEYINGLSRAVSRSKIIIACGPLYGEEGLIYMSSRAIGKPLQLINNKDYGILDDHNVRVIDGSLPLVTNSGLFGGLIIESGPQTLIILSENKAIRKNILERLIHPYIQELSIMEIRKSSAPISPEMRSEEIPPVREEPKVTFEEPEAEVTPEPAYTVPEERAPMPVIPPIEAISPEVVPEPELPAEPESPVQNIMPEETASEPIAEPVEGMPLPGETFIDFSEPAAEPESEENFAEPAAKPVAEPVFEPVSEPASDVAKPVAEPAAELLDEPVYEPQAFSFDEPENAGEIKLDVISDDDQAVPSDEDLKDVANQINLIADQFTAKEEVKEVPAAESDSIPLYDIGSSASDPEPFSAPEPEAEATGEELPFISGIDFTIDEEPDNDEDSDREKKEIEKNFVKNQLGNTEQRQSSASPDRAAHPVFLFEESEAQRTADTPVNDYITPSDDDPAYRNIRNRSGSKSHKSLKTPIIIIAVILAVIVLALCYFLVYLPYTKGISSSEYIKEIFNTSTALLKIVR